MKIPFKRKRTKPKKREYTKVGKPWPLGFMEIIFRGKKYYFYKEEWREAAIKMAKELRRIGYSVRLTTSTRGGEVLKVYTYPRLPD